MSTRLDSALSTNHTGSGIRPNTMKRSFLFDTQAADNSGGEQQTETQTQSTTTTVETSTTQEADDSNEDGGEEQDGE